MDQIFTLEQARLLMPDILARADEAVTVRADLVELQSALNQGTASALGGLPEAKALEAQLSEILGWFSAEGLDLKGIAPLLVDFPAQLDGDTVLLCWLEGERELRWYHKPEHGFAGRRAHPGHGAPEPGPWAGAARRRGPVAHQKAAGTSWIVPLSSKNPARYDRYRSQRNSGTS